MYHGNASNMKIRGTLMNRSHRTNCVRVAARPDQALQILLSTIKSVIDSAGLAKFHSSKKIEDVVYQRNLNVQRKTWVGPSSGAFKSNMPCIIQISTRSVCSCIANSKLGSLFVFSKKINGWNQKFEKMVSARLVHINEVNIKNCTTQKCATRALNRM